MWMPLRSAKMYWRIFGFQRLALVPEMDTCLEELSDLGFDHSLACLVFRVFTSTAFQRRATRSPGPRQAIRRCVDSGRPASRLNRSLLSPTPAGAGRERSFDAS